MSEGETSPPPSAVHDLGPQLESAMIGACEGRLGDVHWFRADWQRSGASTAFATAHGVLEAGDAEVVVKLPVGWREYRTLTQLSGRDLPLPRVVFHGERLGGYDLAWVVMERLPGRPLADAMDKASMAQLMDAVARLYAATRDAWALEPPPKPVDWDRLMSRAREAVRDNSLEHEQQWINAIKGVQKLLPTIVPEWRARARDTWCHGDLHPGNAMVRPEGSAWGSPGVVLLDFAEMHVGHWIEDAIYLERLYWARRDALDGAKPPQLLAKARREAGLPVEEGFQRLAHIRRALLAACVPAYLQREGHPLYLEAALDVLDRALPILQQR